MPKPVARRRCMLKENVLTIGLDADHALSIERAPCSIACFCLAEITAANDGSLRSRRAGSFDLLPVAGIELDGTKAAVKLDEANGNDRGASIGDELFNEGGFVHGFWKQRRASRPVKEAYQKWGEKGALPPQLHNL